MCPGSAQRLCDVTMGNYGSGRPHTAIDLSDTGRDSGRCCSQLMMHLRAVIARPGMCPGSIQESLHSHSLSGQQRSARMSRSLGTRRHRPLRSSDRHFLGRCRLRAGVGTDRRPGESRCDGAVLCFGSCRDLAVTRSMIAILSIPARGPLWDAQRRFL